MSAQESVWSDELILAAVDRAHRHGSPPRFARCDQTNGRRPSRPRGQTIDPS